MTTAEAFGVPSSSHPSHHLPSDDPSASAGQYGTSAEEFSQEQKRANFAAMQHQVQYDRIEGRSAAQPAHGRQFDGDSADARSADPSAPGTAGTEFLEAALSSSSKPFVPSAAAHLGSGASMVSPATIGGAEMANLARLSLMRNFADIDPSAQQAQVAAAVAAGQHHAYAGFVPIFQPPVASSSQDRSAVSVEQQHPANSTTDVQRVPHFWPQHRQAAYSAGGGLPYYGGSAAQYAQFAAQQQQQMFHLAAATGMSTPTNIAHHPLAYVAPSNVQKPLPGAGGRGSAVEDGSSSETDSTAAASPAMQNEAGGKGGYYAQHTAQHAPPPPHSMAVVGGSVEDAEGSEQRAVSRGSQHLSTAQQVGAADQNPQNLLGGSKGNRAYPEYPAATNLGYLRGGGGGGQYLLHEHQNMKYPVRGAEGENIGEQSGQRDGRYRQQHPQSPGGDDDHQVPNSAVDGEGAGHAANSFATDDSQWAAHRKPFGPPGGVQQHEHHLQNRHQQRSNFHQDHSHYSSHHHPQPHPHRAHELSVRPSIPWQSAGGSGTIGVPPPPQPGNRWNQAAAMGAPSSMSHYRQQQGFHQSGGRGGVGGTELGLKLKPIDWANTPLPPVARRNYTPTETVEQRTDSEIQQILIANHITVSGPTPIPKLVTSFEESGFPDWILRSLISASFQQPYAIQMVCWPIALSGRDIIGIAQTGSGKTLAYVLPALVHTKEQTALTGSGGGPSTLVLTPTRELAMQIDRETRKFAEHERLKACCVYGGVGKGHQAARLQSAEICIATPGRLIDFLEEGTTHLRNVSYCVLDEADRMLDMGFEPQIRSIMTQIRPDKQTLMWSATWPRQVHKLALDFCHNHPVTVTIGHTDLQANFDIDQEFIFLDGSSSVPDSDAKLLAFGSWLKEGAPEGRMLIFCETRKGCEVLRSAIRRHRLTMMNVQCIHGDKDQQERDRVLREFKSGHCTCLIATDVASRGLDIKEVECVINYDIPKSVEDYIHRIGRTGRAGAHGKAVTIFALDHRVPGRTKIAQKICQVMRDVNQTPPRELENFAALQSQLPSSGTGSYFKHHQRGGGGFGRGGRGGGRGGGASYGFVHHSNKYGSVPQSQQRGSNQIFGQQHHMQLGEGEAVMFPPQAVRRGGHQALVYSGGGLPNDFAATGHRAVPPSSEARHYQDESSGGRGNHYHGGGHQQNGRTASWQARGHTFPRGAAQPSHAHS